MAYTAKTKAYDLDLEDPDIMAKVNQDVPRQTNKVVTSANFNIASYNSSKSGVISRDKIGETVLQMLECQLNNSLVMHRKACKNCITTGEPVLIYQNGYLYYSSETTESDQAYEARKARIIKRRIAVARSNALTPEEKQKKKKDQQKQTAMNKIQQIAKKHGIKITHEG